MDGRVPVCYSLCWPYCDSNLGKFECKVDKRGCKISSDHVILFGVLRIVILLLYL